HELRTPLTIMLGFSELLLTRNVEEEQRRTWLELVHNEARRLTSVVDDLLDVSRLQGEMIVLKLEPVSLMPLIERVMNEFASKSPGHQFQIDGQVSPIVVADQERVAQILENLVSNAVKYSPSGGPVVVSVAQRNDLAVVTVRDEGLGIPATDLPRLFSRFHRIDLPDRRGIRGTGLGLHLTQNLVERQGGTIEATSKLGKGSTFLFTLPLAPRTAAVGVEDPSRAQSR